MKKGNLFVYKNVWSEFVSILNNLQNKLIDHTSTSKHQLVFVLIYNVWFITALQFNITEVYN